MIRANCLPSAAYHALLITPVQVSGDEEPLFDIWPYVKAVPASDLGGHRLWDEFVECVYRTDKGRFDLVHVCTKTPNIYLVVVVDRSLRTIHGHYLLDLNELYGSTLPA